MCPASAAGSRSALSVLMFSTPKDEFATTYLFVSIRTPCEDLQRLLFHPQTLIIQGYFEPLDVLLPRLGREARLSVLIFSTPKDEFATAYLFDTIRTPCGDPQRLLFHVQTYIQGNF